MTLAHLSDEELLSGLTSVCFETRRLLGLLLLHLIEVEERRLDLRSACSSLYDFCLRRLGMSESEAVRRIEAARLVKRFPLLLGPIERGEIHLTALLLLRGHFTEDNLTALVAAARGKTKREIQVLIAARAPRPDVRPTIEPLSPSRHRLELTIGDELRAKLERARDLMGHRVPDGDLETILEHAADALLAKLGKERLARTARPQRHRRASRPGHVPDAVRREVFARDGERCTHVDEHGDRCPSRTRLEIDHVVPRARGGSDEATNLRVACRAHNRLHAEQCFGRRHVEQRIHLRQRRSSDSIFDVAHRALTGLGFRALDVRRTLLRIRSGEQGAPPTQMRELLRAALGSLTA